MFAVQGRATPTTHHQQVFQVPSTQHTAHSTKHEALNSKHSAGVARAGIANAPHRMRHTGLRSRSRPSAFAPGPPALGLYKNNKGPPIRQFPYCQLPVASCSIPSYNMCIATIPFTKCPFFPRYSAVSHKAKICLQQHQSSISLK